MKVFISWSGETSRQIADALREWLEMTIQAVRPYMSQRDNEAGVRWEEVVSAELNTSDFGILCLTPDNLKSTWLNFEAGALGKAVDRARVIPLLYKLTFADVERPLGMFMAKPLDENGIKDTLIAINNQLDTERRLQPPALDGAFTAMWPMLKDKLARVEQQDASGTAVPRDVRDITEEILELVRGSLAPYTVQSSVTALPVRWRSYSEITSSNPGAAVTALRDGRILERIGQVFGEATVEATENRILVRTHMPLSVLRSDLQREFDHLARDLDDVGLILAIAPMIRRHGQAPSGDEKTDAQ